MTRYNTLADLQRHISPDVRIVETRDQLPPVVAPAEIDAALLALRDAGILGGAAPEARSEHDEQAALFLWAAASEVQHPELSCMFAIPNGGHRHPAVAAQMKAEGVRAGVPDIFLAVRRGRWAGLFVECKRADHSTRPSAAQLMWLERLREQGYCTAVCYGAQEAQQVIMAYLSQEVQRV